MKARDFQNLKKKAPPEKQKLAREKREQRAREIKMCLSKHGFGSKRAVINAIQRRLKSLNAPSQLRAYQCPYCDMWHMTKLLDS